MRRVIILSTTLIVCMCHVVPGNAGGVPTSVQVLIRCWENSVATLGMPCSWPSTVWVMSMPRHMLCEDPSDIARLPCRAGRTRLNRAVHAPHIVHDVRERCLGDRNQQLIWQPARLYIIKMLLASQNIVASMVSASAYTPALNVELQHELREGWQRAKRGACLQAGGCSVAVVLHHLQGCDGPPGF